MTGHPSVRTDPTRTAQLPATPPEQIPARSRTGGSATARTVQEGRFFADVLRSAGDSRIVRESLWHAYGSGQDLPEVPSWTSSTALLPDAQPAFQPCRTGQGWPLPLGTTDLLAGTPYPWSVVAAPVSRTHALAHALAMVFAPIRREPDNPYNDHRSYASPRSAFPVRAFVSDGSHWRLLDPSRRELGGTLERATTHPAALALTGRFTQLPPDYQWFRGSLVNLEIGMVLRALSIALNLFGITGALRLPDTGAVALLRELGPEPSYEWSLPVVVELTGHEPRPTPASGTQLSPRPVAAEDPALADLVAGDRRRLFAGPSAPLGSGIPRRLTHPVGHRSWADVLWGRTSGRMPRGLHGMAARPHPVPAETVANAVRWLRVPAPTPLLRAVAASVRVDAVVGAVEGWPAGTYRLDETRLQLRRADGSALARLEEAYGYPASPLVGCDIRHAAVTWVLTVRPRELMDRFGPSGWSAAQYVCGWMTQGLCLAAAAADQFARPVGAFQQDQLRHVIDLTDDEMVTLAVVVGTERHHGGAVLDLRL